MNGSDLRTTYKQLLLTAVAASAATLALSSTYNYVTKRRRREDLNDDVVRSIERAPTSLARSFPDHAPSGTSTPPATRQGGLSGAYDEELVREQLARNYAFFGEEGMQRIRGASVVVVGCGGVGSWAAVMLVRSGVSKIRLVDFDYVTLSSLNRHATAALRDVGTPKVECVKRALQGVARFTDIDARVELWRKEDGAPLLEGADWVVDAIDNISTKVDLLKYCCDRDIKVFSSMGAGAKCDPTRIQISDLSHTIYDPLARSVRRRLRSQGVTSGIPVVYSTEVPGDVKLLPLPEEEFQKGNVKELGAFDDFRVRILPVLGPLPSIFGLHIATYILCELAGKPITNPLPVKNRRKLYEKLLRELCVRESAIAGEVVNRVPMDEDDVALVFEDIHAGRSVIPPHLVPVRPALVRWNPDWPAEPTNVVAMEATDSERHMRECFGIGSDGQKRRPEDVWGEEVTREVLKRAREVDRWRNWVFE